jgi:hypothetical protein
MSLVSSLLFVVEGILEVVEFACEVGFLVIPVEVSTQEDTHVFVWGVVGEIGDLGG